MLEMELYREVLRLEKQFSKPPRSSQATSSFPLAEFQRMPQMGISNTSRSRINFPNIPSSCSRDLAFFSAEPHLTTGLPQAKVILTLEDPLLLWTSSPDSRAAALCYNRPTGCCGATIDMKLDRYVGDYLNLLVLGRE